MGIVVSDSLGMFPFESASDAGKLDCGLLVLRFSRFARVSSRIPKGRKRGISLPNLPIFSILTAGSLELVVIGDRDDFRDVPYLSAWKRE